jgi:undecaprenyl diphosphate synthase
MKARLGIALLFVSCLVIIILLPKKKEHETPTVLEGIENTVEKSGIFPQHIGLIMDGNRRWARAQGLKAWRGHEAGVTALKKSVTWCLSKKIPYLTVYALSIENLNRSEEELTYLFDIIARTLEEEYLPELVKQGVKIVVAGDQALMPPRLLQSIEYATRQTASNDKLTLTLLFCYGGQQEIAAAAKKLAQQVAAGTLHPDAITPELFSASLWTGHVPPPDLIIRTGNASRLSNFLTYASAYSELYFLSCYWPDLTPEHLEEAIRAYQSSKRNFGR